MKWYLKIIAKKFAQKYQKYSKKSKKYEKCQKILKNSKNGIIILRNSKNGIKISKNNKKSLKIVKKPLKNNKKSAIFNKIADFLINKMFKKLNIFCFYLFFVINIYFLFIFDIDIYLLSSLLIK